MRHPVANTIPTAETPVLNDEQRRERLQRLAERLVSEDGLDHATLERIEQLSGDEH
jgi:hypothetical protein